MEKLISIIIPVYNVEKYLKRCLESVIHQTYINLEILLIDDGSIDKSLEICKEYEKIDSRIKVYSKSNEGLGLTRNYGLKRANGEFITFIDSDDYIVKNAIEMLYLKEKETDADVIIANSYYKNIEQEVYLCEGLYAESEIKDILIVHAMGNSPRFLDGLSYTAWGKLYKKSILYDNGIEFPSERKMIWEDLVFNTNVYSVSKSIYVSHYPIYYYCYNDGSLTHTYKPNKLNMIMDLYKYMIKKIEILNLSDEAKIRLNNNFIGHIRTCIKLEVYYVKSNGFNRAFKNIENICKNSDVQELIKSYPVKNFNKSQLIFNVFMKIKFIVGVYFLTWLQNKKMRIE